MLLHNAGTGNAHIDLSESNRYTGQMTWISQSFWQVSWRECQRHCETWQQAIWHFMTEMPDDRAMTRSSHTVCWRGDDVTSLQLGFGNELEGGLWHPHIFWTNWSVIDPALSFVYSVYNAVSPCSSGNSWMLRKCVSKAWFYFAKFSVRGFVARVDVQYGPCSSLERLVDPKRLPE